MKVIAISAWKNSGKDMLAAYLVEKYGAKRVSFADPLKDMTSEEYEVSRTSLDKQEEKELPLLHLPVNPQDAFSSMIAEFMFREFRTKSGQIASNFTYIDEKFEGISESGIQTLYWTPRALAILKGSVNRSVASNFWVQKALDTMRESGSHLVVVPDLRYKSEMTQLKEAFGENVTFIRVNRFDSSPSKDPSEHDLDDATFDFYVENATTKESCFYQLEDILDHINF